VVVGVGVAPAADWLAGTGLDPAGIATDAAARQGAAAATAMLGDDPLPPPLPSFWSDQYGVRIQYVGYAEDADSVRVDGEPDDCDFSVLYSRGDRPVAALTVGRPRELIALRRLIEDGNDVTTQPEEMAA
jgi:NADPH-dependent 2,4-dienoyl-CoA reductase/sulfur reductase-like enzyme